MCHQSDFATCRSPTPKLLWIEAFLRHLGDQDSEVQKLCKNQASKPSRTSTSKLKNTRSRIIQTICLDPKVCWNQAQKPPETSTNHKSVKLYGFKPPKPQRTSTTNLWRRRTHEEHEKQRISKKLIARDSL